MNPRLVKFAVELQTTEQVKQEEKCIYFKNGGKKHFAGFLRSAEITIPIDKNI